MTNAEVRQPNPFKAGDLVTLDTELGARVLANYPELGDRFTVHRVVEISLDGDHVRIPYQGRVNGWLYMAFKKAALSSKQDMEALYD
jgi:hypothetical protein